MSQVHAIRGFNKSGTRFLRADVLASDSGEAIRKFRQMHPDAGPLHCRPPKHKEAVMDELFTILTLGDHGRAHV